MIVPVSIGRHLLTARLQFASPLGPPLSPGPRATRDLLGEELLPSRSLELLLQRAVVGNHRGDRLPCLLEGRRSGRVRRQPEKLVQQPDLGGVVSRQSLVGDFTSRVRCEVLVALLLPRSGLEEVSEALLEI